MAKPQPWLTPEAAACLRKEVSEPPRASCEQRRHLTSPGNTGEPAPGAQRPPLTQEADRQTQSRDVEKWPRERVLQKVGVRLTSSTSSSPRRASAGAKRRASEGGLDLGSATPLADDAAGDPTANTANAAGPSRTLRRRLGNTSTMPEAFGTNLPVTNQGLITAVKTGFTTHTREFDSVQNHEK